MNALTTRLPNAFLGFDNLFRNMDEAFKGNNDFPPHDLLKFSDTEFTIELALAGYEKDNLKVVLDSNILTVEGERQKADANYLYRGISGRGFVKRFALADDLEIKNCDFENGMLVISLVREVPESEKPKLIDIK